MKILSKFLTFYDGLRRATRYSWISIFIILIIILLSTLAQGQTIFVDLLDHNPFNLFFCFLLLEGLAMIVSHFPIYLEKWYLSRNKIIPENEYVWQINYEGIWETPEKILNFFKEWLGIGFITFRRNNSGPASEDPFEKGEVYTITKTIRKYLGISLYLAILYLLLTTLKASVYPQISVMLIWIPSLVASIAVYLLIQKFAKPSWLPICVFFFWSSIFLKIALLYISSAAGWSPLVWKFFIAIIIFDIIKFSLFRKLRSKFKALKFYNFFMSIKNHTIYIISMALTGMLSWMIIFYAHMFFFRVNTLVIILAYLNVIYGLMIIPIKLYLYHKNLAAFDKGNIFTDLIKSGVPILTVVLVLWTFVSMSLGNELHRLPLVAQDDSSVIDKVSYCEAYDSHFENRDKVFFISSYGGGLKANAWNLLLLDSLRNYNGVNIISSTAAMSGVSGGSLGQAFYTSLYKNVQSKEQRTKLISRVSRSDFLSIDAAYFLGKDFIREFSLFRHRKFTPDRAIQSMRAYSHKLTDTTLYQKSFQTYWAELFRTNRFYPMLVSNSAATHIQRGIACSVDFKEDFQHVFHNAINILNIKADTSLSFVDALSCSNRFPIFSPAAKVPDKGHFLDGGYFDNSALLSLLDVYDYLEDDKMMEGKERIFIQIINSKSEYIKYFLKTLKKGNKVIDPIGELSAIVGTATSIDMLPRYLVARSEQSDEFTFTQIHLPYKIYPNDVDAFFDAKVQIPDLENKLKAHNSLLDEAIKSSNFNEYDVIEPPLARMLGDQAFNYMKAMIKHGNVFKELDAILEK